MHSSVSLFSIMSNVHNPCIFYEAAIRLEICLAIAGVANQSETNSHISCCAAAKKRIIHMGTYVQNPISSSLTHILLLS